MHIDQEVYSVSMAIGQECCFDSFDSFLFANWLEEVLGNAFGQIAVLLALQLIAV